jgi:hypothetical protein
MAKWVIRRMLDGKAASKAMFCAESRPVLDGTGVRSVEDHIRELLENDERMEGGGIQRQIFRGDELVGSIEITKLPPPNC